MDTSESDPVDEWNPSGDQTGLEEPIWRLGLEGGSESYPERPDEPDCIYYLKTGFCGYGSRCRFNHPPDRSSVLGGMRSGGGGDYPERIGEPVCQGEKECSYYVKTGQCKFGVTCKFHHPQPTTIIPPPPKSHAPPPPPLPPPEYGVFARPSVPGPYMPGPYTPLLLPPGMVPFPGWNPYQAPVRPAATPNTVGAGSFYAIASHLSPPVPSYTGSRLSMPSSSSIKQHSFPQRPGEPVCQYYLKTRDCKFGLSCRYHHPPELTVPSPNYVLSPMGLPLRPGAPLCTHYSQKGVCKFGPACKFDHPMGMLSYTSSADLAPYPAGFSVATLAQSSSSSDPRPDLKDGGSTSMPSGSAGSSSSHIMPVSDSTGSTTTITHGHST